MNSRRARLIAAYLLVVGLSIVQAQTSEEQPAEQVFKNIQVFKSLPASQLRPTMSFMAASLGVSCDYCHTNPWDSDAKKTKTTARQMILMMRKINQDNFSGRLVVNCATCHKGHTSPSDVPPLPSIATVNKESPARVGPANLPTIDQVFDRYVQSIGGQTALNKLNSRFSKATEVSSDGSTATIEAYAKSPNQLLVTTTFNPPAKGVYVQGFDGDSGWSRFNVGRVNAVTGLDLAQLTRDAEFYKGLNRFRSEFANITFVGQQQIDGHDVYVIQGLNTQAFYERLFFDTKTALLLRRSGVLKTALGSVMFQADYDDYREVDGIKLPFITRWSMPTSSWIDTITDAKHNVDIDQRKFVKP